MSGERQEKAIIITLPRGDSRSFFCGGTEVLHSAPISIRKVAHDFRRFGVPVFNCFGEFEHRMCPQATTLQVLRSPSSQLRLTCRCGQELITPDQVDGKQELVKLMLSAMQLGSAFAMNRPSRREIRLAIQRHCIPSIGAILDFSVGQELAPRLAFGGIRMVRGSSNPGNYRLFFCPPDDTEWLAQTAPYAISAFLGQLVEKGQRDELTMKGLTRVAL